MGGKSIVFATALTIRRLTNNYGVIINNIIWLNGWCSHDPCLSCGDGIQMENV